jgi:hypothetical protein
MGTTQPTALFHRPVGISALSAARRQSVNLTHETVVCFDGAVDPATITSDFFTAQGAHGGHQVSSTERFATFYDALPAQRGRADRWRRIAVAMGCFSTPTAMVCSAARDRRVPYGSAGASHTNAFGYVRDSYTGQLIIGATFRVDGLAGVSVTTDANGRL